MKLGENIRRYRQEAGLSLRELADMVDVTYSTLSHYENGRTVPRYDTLKRLARALGVDSVYYLYGDEDQDEYDRMMRERDEQITLEQLRIAAKHLATLGRPEGRLLDAFFALNEEGQKKLLDYAEDLVASGRYE